MDMVSKPNTIDMAERDLDRLIVVGLRQGLTSWDWLDLLLRKAVNLHIRASEEYKNKGGT